MDYSRSKAKSQPRSWWHLGLDIVIIHKGLSVCGARSFLTVSVLSLSLSSIILADFFCFFFPFCGGACLSSEIFLSDLV